MGTRRRTYAPLQLRQRRPRRFLLMRCLVELSLGNVTATHSPKGLGVVRVLCNRSFVEAIDRDIEVQPTDFQILALLSHVTPMMAPHPGQFVRRRCAYSAQIANLKSDRPEI